MKRFILSAFAALAIFTLNAQPPEGNANVGDFYGEKVSAENAINLSDIAAKLESAGKIEDARIKAKIVEVCPKKGCWITLDIDGKTTAMVKMKDYGFFLPLSAKGKTVVIDGEVSLKTTSVAELKHYAEDARKSKEEIDAITQPKKEVRVLAKGIVVVE